MSAWEFEPEFWHLRFSEQARWTRQVREYLFKLAKIESASLVLEVGCGTGAVIQELLGQELRPANLGEPGDQPVQTESKPFIVSRLGPVVYGLDISLESLKSAQKHAPLSALCCGDGHHLPYAANSFDIACCHFTLLWVARPSAVIAEMRRVTRPGGWVLSLAEPDYGGRVDHPIQLSPVGMWQRQALQALGADPFVGRSLGALFISAGLRHVQSGVLGGQWQHPSLDDGGLEWAVFEKDLNVLPELPDKEEIETLRNIDLQARRSGERMLYTPTFYAAGVV